VALCVACSGRDAAKPPARVSEVLRDTAPLTPPPGPMTVDTAHAVVLEVWPMTVERGRQLDETRRIVEFMHAELAFVRGFESATLLASGDGSTLVLMAAWQDTLAADSARSQLMTLLRTEADTTLRRKRLGTATARVHVRRTAGTAPVFTDATMLQLTRYAVKPGHSFGALAALADTNLVMRVLQDTSAAGGATLAATDSGAVYMLLQARSATTLDAAMTSSGPLPFWAPFATRDEQLLAVVAMVSRRAGR
jgi:hypothetical protein